ncbi:glycosyltransferase family 4 protein [Pelagicoccus sp. SDUM812002]|uniref:glycosyltransferase family 4 protein n=1 Tax=Pelagicoccus sp. SDUM812002 TaxID=3041266 RepID=UPI002810EC71|nr:glycosyltransferase family 4 protein [Pelagicoccus sp. SDUM812002]
MGSLSTLREARRQKIPSFLERPNAHTRFAFDVVKEENLNIGINLPIDHDHTYNSLTLQTEIEEYKTADFLLCPSEFVKTSFINEGFPKEKLIRHQYGCDLQQFVPKETIGTPAFQAIYAGVCEPRKGLHYALRAWRASRACESGKFFICGSFVPGYREKLASLLDHPSIQYLGHRNDLPEIMGKSNVFILSSMEEGSALVTYEARASGCVLLVSESTGAIGDHQRNALLHEPRDWQTLAQHLDQVYLDDLRLTNLRESSLKDRDQLSWTFAGSRLANIYREYIS